MTAGESSTICNVIQAFPVLLILSQNANKCLNTPFNYKPPTPTHPPEYYEAYDALIHTLLHDSHDCGHGYDKRYLVVKKPCYNHGHGSSEHGHNAYNHGYGSPNFGYVYPNIDKYPGHGYPGYSYQTGDKYPGYSSSGEKYPGFAYPNVYKYPGYPSYETVYPVHEGGYHGYSHNGYKVANGYNVSTDYVYKTNYAPNQIYNTKHKHKVVVVKRRRHEKLQRLSGESVVLSNVFKYFFN